MTGKNQVLLELKNNLSELERLNMALEEFGSTHGLPLKTVLDINLALDEIFTNIVAYGFSDNNEQLIKIFLSLEDREVCIRVEDYGVSFNPLDLPEPDSNPDLETSKIGGLGVHLVRKLVEELKYQRISGKNVLLLKKIIK